MSKAFTKETDDEEDDDSKEPLPPSGKNYMTPGGLKKIQDELHQLFHVERPQVTSVVNWAAGNGDRSENADYIYGKRRLREIDRRVRFLSKRLDTAEVIDPTTVKIKDQVLFGATVTIRDEEGIEKIYRIVGIDESDALKGKVSWISPIGVALMKAKVDDVVIFRSPKGPRELEILKIEYLVIE
jgi:transcription elongation factor GreB